MEYGEKIAKLRAQKNLSQEELADYLFVSRTLVSKWENNKRNPNDENLKKLANLFSVEIDFFEPINKTIMKNLSKCIPKDLLCKSDDHMIEVLDNFLITLSERDSNIFVRKYFFADTTISISEEFHLDEVYVRVILSRTRNKLKIYLEKRCNKNQK